MIRQSSRLKMSVVIKRSACLAVLFLQLACTPSGVNQDNRDSQANQTSQASEKLVTASQLAHHRWVLKTIDGEAVLSNRVGAYGKGLVPELDFGEAQHVGGFAGCNQFSGQFVLNEQGQFRVEQLATTMMMCSDDAMLLEQRYARMLNEWSHIAIKNNELTLQQGEQVWLFNLFDWVQ
ncbi:META domain-containing protein [Simiduia curdlanivorans]|uniref:META domain-containing protein n=1 Tax=Simiduia curdlanivorans TaxID=1492769 RepID=A0ABV8V3N8_9GAMM|nr:META domain-containing protein [Simiduia curdlanivorans]MDN3637264.1 META domain-containing protein [Simiduia curdlanivorans]